MLTLKQIFASYQTYNPIHNTEMPCFELVSRACSTDQPQAHIEVKLKQEMIMYTHYQKLNKIARWN